MGEPASGWQGSLELFVHILIKEIASARDNWHQADCLICDGYTTGSESAAEEWGYEHVLTCNAGQPVMDVAVIEKLLADAVVQAAEEICAHLALGSLGAAAVLDIMQPYLHGTARAFMAACEAGDNPEQFAARVAALPKRQCVLMPAALSTLSPNAQAFVYRHLSIRCATCPATAQLFSNGERVSLAPLSGWETDGSDRWRCPSCSTKES